MRKTSILDMTWSECLYLFVNCNLFKSLCYILETVNLDYNLNITCVYFTHIVSTECRKQSKTVFFLLSEKRWNLRHELRFSFLLRRVRNWSQNWAPPRFCTALCFFYFCRVIVPTCRVHRVKQNIQIAVTNLKTHAHNHDSNV